MQCYSIRHQEHALSNRNSCVNFVWNSLILWCALWPRGLWSANLMMSHTHSSSSSSTQYFHTWLLDPTHPSARCSTTCGQCEGGRACASNANITSTVTCIVSVSPIYVNLYKFSPCPRPWPYFEALQEWYWGNTSIGSRSQLWLQLSAVPISDTQAGHAGECILLEKQSQQYLIPSAIIMVPKSKCKPCMIYIYTPLWVL